MIVCSALIDGEGAWAWPSQQTSETGADAIPARVTLSLDEARARVSQTETMLTITQSEKQSEARRLATGQQEIQSIAEEAATIANETVSAAIRNFQDVGVHTNFAVSRDLNAAVRAKTLANSAIVADERTFTRFWDKQKDLDIAQSIQEIRRQRIQRLDGELEVLQVTLDADMAMLTEMEERAIQQGARASSVAVSGWAQNLGNKQGFYLMTCPVAGTHSFIDSWGFPRSGGRRHKGVDMIANTGVPIVAPIGGRVEHYSNRVGGRSFRLFDDYGNYFYGTHLSGFGKSGRVVAGEVIGYVGDDGNARGIPHLHFEIHPGGYGNPINPFIDTAAVCDGARY